ncbi:MAG: DUF2769 domain-containing protein [Thermoplasmata archaeon]|nr:DUF2769 domain-containing protein [Thermoplasmata archaeon]
MDMSPEEMEQKEQMVVGQCICKGCPSYVECGESVGYCFPTIGKSKCIEDEMACICKACHVYPMMGLTEWYFCTRGSEKVQKGG